MSSTDVVDPGKPASSLAKDQAVNLVKTISSKTVVELTAMREQIDALMRAITEREHILITDIEDHATFAVDAINMKEIVRESLEQLTKRITPVLTVNGSGK